MPKKASKTKSRKIELITGDLVYHLLYGRSWVGLLLSSVEEKVGLSAYQPKGLIHMQPNTEYEFFFKRALTLDRISDSMGYVSMNWLRKLERINYE